MPWAGRGWANFVCYFPRPARTRPSLRGFRRAGIHGLQEPSPPATESIRGTQPLQETQRFAASTAVVPRTMEPLAERRASGACGSGVRHVASGARVLGLAGSAGPAGAKSRFNFWELYAALKRRSSTLLHASVSLLLPGLGREASPAV